MNRAVEMIREELLKEERIRRRRVALAALGVLFVFAALVLTVERPLGAQTWILTLTAWIFFAAVLVLSIRPALRLSSAHTNALVLGACFFPLFGAQSFGGPWKLLPCSPLMVASFFFFFFWVVSVLGRYARRFGGVPAVSVAACVSLGGAAMALYCPVVNIEHLLGHVVGAALGALVGLAFARRVRPSPGGGGKDPGIAAGRSDA